MVDPERDGERQGENVGDGREKRRGSIPPHYSFRENTHTHTK